MALSEIGQEDLARTLRGGERLAVLLAANYEERSLAALRWLIGVTQKPFLAERSERIAVGLLSLRSKSPLGLLGDTSAANQAMAIAALNRAGLPHKLFTLTYPEPDPREIKQALGELFKLFGPPDGPCRLVWDISALPRGLIVDILELLCGSEWQENYPVKAITYLYAWAGHYPNRDYPESVGKVKGQITGRDLGDLIEQHAGENSTAIVVTCGEGHDASQTYEELLRDRITRHVYFFFYRDDPLTSLHCLRANQELLSQARRRHDRFEYLFSPADVSRRLEHVASNVATRPGGFFVVAPFGPKPLTVAAYLAVAKCRHDWRKKRRTSVADVLLMPRSQYTSVYSLGVRSLSAYESTVPVIASGGTDTATAQ